MDYKEKYEAALERAKKIYKSAPDINLELEEIFPELSESEDERIIHCLEEIIDWGCSKNISVECGVDLKAVKSWLEKHKNYASNIKWADEVITDIIVSLADDVDYNMDEPLKYKKEIDALKRLREELGKYK